MIFGVSAMLASMVSGVVLPSCTQEAELSQGPVMTVEGKYPVVLDIKGLFSSNSTRAGESNETYAALKRERTIKSLYAVAFTNDELLYKVYDLTSTLPQTADNGGYLPSDSDVELPHFDLEELNDYQIYFVANPGDEFLGMINGLTPGVATKAEFCDLTQTVADERVGKEKGTLDEFLMVSPNVQYVRPVPEQVTRLTVVLERAAARFDIFNQIEGVAITGFTFENCLHSTKLFAPTSVTDGQEYLVCRNLDVDFQGNFGYGADGIEGTITQPGEYVAETYTYEYLTEAIEQDTKAPKITISYKVKGDDDTYGEVKTKQVIFKVPQKNADGTYKFSDEVDADGNPMLEYKDENGQEEIIPIKRNYLYRIRLVAKEDIDRPVIYPIIEVVDWQEGAVLDYAEWHKDLPWYQRVPGLLAYRFLPYALQKNDDGQVIDMASKYAFFNPSNMVSDGSNLTDYDYRFAGYDETGSFVSTSYFTLPWQDGIEAHRYNFIDARFRLPSPDELCAITMNLTEAEADAALANGEYEHTYTDMFGREIVDKGYVTSGNDMVLYAVRFFGTDQCALYKYEGSEGSTLVTIYPLTSDGHFVDSYAAFNGEPRSINAAFKFGDDRRLYFTCPEMTEDGLNGEDDVEVGDFLYDYLQSYDCKEENSVSRMHRGVLTIKLNGNIGSTNYSDYGIYYSSRAYNIEYLSPQVSVMQIDNTNAQSWNKSILSSIRDLPISDQVVEGETKYGAEGYYLLCTDFNETAVKN